MAEAATVHTWKVGRFTAELSIPSLGPGGPVHAVVEWSPRMPGRPLTSSEQQQYQAGLAEAMRIAAHRAGVGGFEGGNGL